MKSKRCSPNLRAHPIGKNERSLVPRLNADTNAREMTTQALLTTLLLAFLAAAPALLAVWAATSKRCWFWRALAIWACVAVLLPIRVYEPAIVFAIGLPLIVGVIQGTNLAQRWYQANRDTALRFGLRDVLLAIVIVGLCLAVLRVITQSAPRMSAHELAVPAIVMAGLTVAVCWMVRGSRHVVAGVAVVFIVPLSAWLIWPQVGWLFAIETLNLGFWNAFISAMSQNQKYYFQGLRVCGAGLLAFAVIVFSGLFVSLPRWKSLHQSNAALGIKIFAGTATGLWLAWMYWQFARFSPFPPSIESPENHAPRIIEIAERVRILNPWQPSFSDGRPISAHDASTGAELSQLYDELLILLPQTNSMPFDPATDTTPDYIQQVVSPRMSSLREICRSFMAEWRDAESKGDRERALAFVYGNLSLGRMNCRNSNFNECCMGHSYMDISRRYFFDKRDSLTDEQITSLVAALAQAEEQHDPLEAIYQRDIALDERACGWQWRIPQIISPGKRDQELWKSIQRSYNHWLVVNRLLITDLAIRQYRRDHDARPASLEMLVPNYLKLMPIDPFSGHPLMYCVLRDDFLLYSVGSDGFDDGGRLGDSSSIYKQGFDIDLDAFTRPYGTEVSPRFPSTSTESNQEAALCD